MTRIIDDRDSGDRHRRGIPHLIAGCQTGHAARQRLLSDQHRKIMQRVSPLNPGLPGRPSLQRIHHRRLTHTADAKGIKHVPRRDKHPSADLETGASRHTSLV